MRLLPTLRTVEDDELEAARRRREEVRVARVEIARRNTGWTEIPETRLIPKGPARFGWLCDAETDYLWRRATGAIFVNGSVNLIATHVAVTYYVDQDGDLVALERAAIPTWSDVIRQRPELAKAAAR